jgi:hypothetical protein
VALAVACENRDLIELPSGGVDPGDDDVSVPVAGHVGCSDLLQEGGGADGANQPRSGELRRHSGTGSAGDRHERCCNPDDDPPQHPLRR